MENYNQVRRKLEAFIRKFYLNKLLKGLLLFLAIGLLYFLVVLAIEYFLWLNPSGRTFLFWIFVGVEVMFVGYLIISPLAKLLKFSHGINDEDASKIIGEHFPEVGDKLLNVLQLKKYPQQSDLLLASVEQKSSRLSTVPFTRAVDFKDNSKYLKYALFPLLLILGLLLSGNINLVTAPWDRVKKYNTSFEAPAPFRFMILNDSLKIREHSDFIVRVGTRGKMIPEKPEISYNGQSYFLKQIGPEIFEHNFKRLQKNVNFRLKANGIVSQEYRLEILKVPQLLDFNMKFDYPGYTGKVDDSLNGTGNGRVPEGTKITWRFNTRNTEILNFFTPDSLVKLFNSNPGFFYTKKILSGLDYRVSTSNNFIKNFEALEYAIEVIKDEYPDMEIQQKLDSTDKKTSYFYGKLSDDYGLKYLELVYFVEGEEDSLFKQEIPVSKTSFDEFHYTFPGDLTLKPGHRYNFYFQVWDNDGVNGSKYSRSRTFGFRERTLEELEEENLKRQDEAIQDLGKSLEEIKSSDQELDRLNRLQKENKSLNYNQRKKLDEFLDRQKQQSSMMRAYTEKLEKSLEKEQQGMGSESAQKEALKKRLDRNEERLKENEALLEELKEIADKIDREEFGEKLEELSKRNQAEENNLEQLLELTKRYYVEEKLQKLARDLDKLSDKQAEISKEFNDGSLEKQQGISNQFEKFQDEMDALEKANNRLQKPTEMVREKLDEESIQKDLQSVKEHLEKQEEKSAREKQEESAKQMKQMSRKMQQRAMRQNREELKADIESLRQILDNLITFSFQQEGLLEDFSHIDIDYPAYAAKLRRQSNLRDNFRHIDDSLFSLALRNPMITEDITQRLTDIEFDMNKSLERLAENELPQGKASQQYVVTGANGLAYMLSQILSSMQKQANPQLGKGQGEGSEFQLQDIIKKQQELIKEFQQKGEQKQQPGEGRKPGEAMGESEMGELFEIYKQQQQIRQELMKFNQQDNSGEGTGIEREMEELEKQLLEKGFDPQNLEQLQRLQHELMEYDNASFKQGQSSKRESQTNLKNYESPVKNQDVKAKEYFNSIEILNRQSLPLHENYKQKVRSYFERENN